ncbi:MAG: hypothetical protein ACOZDY_16585 [Pseudomonadota bacterium]
MITHATVRVTGEPADLEPFQARLRDLLAEEDLAGEAAEHHGDDYLHYDLKVEGGVPFPPFVTASQEFPRVTLAVEWFSADGAARGSAAIQNGRLVDHAAEAPGGAGAGAAFVGVDRQGALEIGIRLLRAGPNEWRGYVVSADRDALFRIRREEPRRRATLVATAGAAPEWQVRWVVDLAAESFEESALAPGEPIAEDDFRELVALADAFAGEWLWFASAPAEDIAVERQRYERLGFPVREANVRTAKLNAMTQRKDGGLLASGLPEGEHWIKEVLEQCWASNG